MLAGDVNVRPANRPLELAPMSLNRVCVVDTAHPFLKRVVHAPMLTEGMAQIVVSAVLVSRDDGFRINVAQHQWLKGVLHRIWHGASDDLAVPLHHAHDDHLVGALASAITALLFSPDP